MPLKRNSDGTFEELNWEDALSIARKKLTSVKGDEIAGVIGEFADVESIVAFKDFLNRLDCENFEIR